ESYPNCYFKQTADIDLSGYTCWNALCGEYSSNGNPTNPFTGVYDGGNKKIKNFTIHSSESIEYAGLFGCVNSGTIKNLTVDGFSIRGATENTPLNVFGLGIIATQIDNNSSITDCHITDSSAQNATYSSSIADVGPINSGLGVGGICYDNNGIITNCSVEKCQFKCLADNAQSVFIGGICVENFGTITNCSLKEVIIDCSVNLQSGSEKIGGICVNNCFATLTSCSLINSYISGSKGETGALYVGGISAYHDSNESITSCEVQNSRVSGSGRGAYVGGIAAFSGEGRSIATCSVKNGSLVDGTGNDCSVGGIGGNNLAVTNSYLDGSTVKVNGETCMIGGVCGKGLDITKCYVKDSDVFETTSGSGGNVGGICGRNENNIASCYLLNSNVSGTRYVGGISGYLNYFGYAPIVSSCYVSEDDNHSISKANSSGEVKLGYLVGLLYKNDSNPAFNAKIKDSFYNRTASNLSDLVYYVGNGTTNSAPPNDYGYAINCYGGINATNFANQTWSNDAWSDYKTINATNWPPDLKENPRP
ncbi:MAG: hypothetical protein IKP71_10200, partial [Candidatus Riflebacteria bacterium]|nr:hypothetical protein [Candidatus Riflebacteria bacterium]